MPLPFSPEQNNDEVLATVIASYFTQEELAQARELERTESYVAAIAFLSKAGQQSLRHSGEDRPPRVYLTIPGGRILIHHPARLFPAPTLYAFSVTHLARQVFVPLLPTSAQETPASEASGTSSPLFFETSPAPPSQHQASSKPAKKHTVRPRIRVFVEQAIRIGTKKLFWTRSGWAVKKGYLGYVPTKLSKGGYQVELVHLVSYWVMATVYVDMLDDTTHRCLQRWVSEAQALTDWSQGIAAILKEQPGKEKRWAWAKKLQDRWLEIRLEPQQLSFF